MKARSIGTLLMALLLGFGMTQSMGCSRALEYQMDSGPRTTGAEGNLVVEKDGNGNHSVSLKVAHLPMPSQLDSRMSTYVVWIYPNEERTPYNMGRLRLSEDRTGEISFITPFGTFDMIVTAEVDRQVLAPSNEIVLRRTIGAN